MSENSKTSKTLDESAVKIDFSSRDLMDATVTVKTSDAATPILKAIQINDNSASTTQLTLPFDASNHIKERPLYLRQQRGSPASKDTSVKAVDAFCNAKRSQISSISE